MPEKAKVYVIVPDLQSEKTARVFSPHLANPTQVSDFKMEVSEDDFDASI